MRMNVVVAVVDLLVVDLVVVGLLVVVVNAAR